MNEQNVYVVSVWNDHDLYLSRAYPTPEGAEEQLAIIRSEWAERYGDDGFTEETDAWRVEVLDGPYAQLHMVEVAPGGEEADWQRVHRVLSEALDRQEAAPGGDA